jgi:alkyl sulfatase BDS1-like metallo-beta-lactamase superfamily hydrolase
MTSRTTTIVMSVLMLLSGAAQRQEPTNEQKLIDHTDEFRREVIQVTDGVWVAVGFALANSILIEGDGGAIVVDTTESQRAARQIAAEFAKLTSQPLRAIVYTHNHYDHVNGTPVFLETLAGDQPVEIYAHETLPSLVERRSSEVATAMLPRNIRQFGIPLHLSARPNCGIGPCLTLDPTLQPDFRAPTTTFVEQLEVEVAGIEMKLVHAPGETDDQLYVWLPGKRTMLPGDNYYKAFPNLYAIRGTPYRDVRGWADSLDLMLAERPEHLVPSHSRPVSGEARIREILSDYRDAIRAVYEQTLAGMNRGLGPDRLADTVELPERLQGKPYLEQFYGTVPWSVRAIYAGNLGWFDGNPTNLFPLSPAARAERMVALAGGAERLMDEARRAQAAGDPQWTAELVDHLLALEPDHAEARALKAAALIALGRQQTSANARNYYMTSAQELGGTPPAIQGSTAATPLP